MPFYQKHGLAVRHKQDASPVTEADIAAHTCIAERLQQAYPEIPLLSEEGEWEAIETSQYFLVDPLDGTKEFIRKRDAFTVNIALIEHGVPIEGVIYAPALNQLYYTQDRKTYYAEITPASAISSMKSTPCTVSHRPEGSPMRVVASRSHRSDETNAFIDSMEIESIISVGSSLKLCQVAAGKADIYPRFAPTMLWDTGAGDAILRNAGGRTYDTDGELLTYPPKPPYRNPYFIADGRKQS